MTKDGRVQSSRRAEKSKRATNKFARRKSVRTSTHKKSGWSDVFDKLTYSSGPGDNIYVYG